MSIQSYHCNTCRIDFDVTVPMTPEGEVPLTIPCLRKGDVVTDRPHQAEWRPPTGIHIIVEGGTDAGKGGRDR